MSILKLEDYSNYNKSKHPTVIKQVSAGSKYGDLISGKIFDNDTSSLFYELEDVGLYYVKEIDGDEYYLFFDGTAEKPIALKNKWAMSNPASATAGVNKLRQDNRIERFLQPHEEQKLLSLCVKKYAYLRPILICALHTGMRRGEIFGLKWENVNMKTGCITLTETKNGKIRKIPISKTLKEELKKFNRFTEYVFTNNETGKPYSDIKKGYKSLCDAARIKNLRFHDLRHTAATRMVASGIDLVIVQDILGHADLKTTQRYAHPVPERKQKAIEALDEYCANFA